MVVLDVHAHGHQGVARVDDDDAVDFEKDFGRKGRIWRGELVLCVHGEGVVQASRWSGRQAASKIWKIVCCTSMLLHTGLALAPNRL